LLNRSMEPFLAREESSYQSGEKRNKLYDTVVRDEKPPFSNYSILRTELDIIGCHTFPALAKIKNGVDMNPPQVLFRQVFS